MLHRLQFAQNFGRQKAAFVISREIGLLKYDFFLAVPRNASSWYLFCDKNIEV